MLYAAYYFSYFHILLLASVIQFRKENILMEQNSEYLSAIKSMSRTRFMGTQKYYKIKRKFRRQCIKVWFKTIIRFRFVLVGTSNQISSLCSNNSKESTNCFTSQLRTYDFFQSSLQIYTIHYKSRNQNTICYTSNFQIYETYSNSERLSTVCYTSQFGNLQLLAIKFSGL